MQSSISVRMTEGREAHGWLHKTAGADTLVVLCHGHNSNGDRGRFITLARWFEHAQLDCLRWNAQRMLIEPDTYEVTTVSEEYEQVKELLDTIRRKYKNIIAIGHSQGALLALKLCTTGYAQTFISLMGVCDTIEGLERKKALIGINSAIGSTAERPFVLLPNGLRFVYSNEFFTDFKIWNVPDLLAMHRGASLFISASDDSLISSRETQIGFSAAHEPKKLLTIQDSHNFSEENARLIAHAIRDWLETIKQ